jgi:hypothetical protein
MSRDLLLFVVVSLLGVQVLVRFAPKSRGALKDGGLRAEPRERRHVICFLPMPWPIEILLWIIAFAAVITIINRLEKIATALEALSAIKESASMMEIYINQSNDTLSQVETSINRLHQATSPPNDIPYSGWGAHAPTPAPTPPKPPDAP